MLNGSLTPRHVTGPTVPSAPRSSEIQPSPETFLGVSPALRRLLLQAEIVAPRLQLALLEGEPGTGKHLFARTLHRKSPFAASPFRRRDAREWLATETDLPPLDGTLYLDRVDLLSSAGQHLLLSFIKAVQSDPAVTSRFLLLTSSHAPLRQLVTQGHFLSDLAFRLLAVRFVLPPLREHREDIAPIAQSILERICHRYQQPVATLGPAALQHLMHHPWPGNIRELASVLESAIIDSPTSIISHSALNLPSPPAASPQPVAASEPALPLTLESAIHRHIQLVLNLNHGNKLRAAKQLGISRSTLYRILAGESLKTESAILP